MINKATTATNNGRPINLLDLLAVTHVDDKSSVNWVPLFAGCPLLLTYGMACKRRQRQSYDVRIQETTP